VNTSIPQCEFCKGLKFQALTPHQFIIGGEQVWLHDQQCRGEYEREYWRQDAMGIPEAPSDGHMYVRKDKEWVKMPSGFSTKFEYTFETTTTAPPTNSQLRLDNADAAQATKMWLHNSDADALDVSNLLKLIESGFIIFVQDKNDPTQAHKFRASGPIVAQTGYCEIPITHEIGTGALGDNQRVLVVVYGGG
jgi:hypothetical protein